MYAQPVARQDAGPVSPQSGPAGLAPQHMAPAPPLPAPYRASPVDGARSRAGTRVLRIETEVDRDRRYLDPAGRMCPGAVLAAGQGDRLLTGRDGAAHAGRSERSYRLLGCDPVFHGPLPVPGQTLRYEISVDDPVEAAGIPLFAFQYDAYVGEDLRLSVRRGQAGLFTDEELGASGGVLWTPEQNLARSSGPFVLPPGVSEDTSFDAARVRAFAEGRPADCFGTGWQRARSHVRTPRPADGQDLLFDEVTDFDPRGGPLGRGHLRARLHRVPSLPWSSEQRDGQAAHLSGLVLLQGCYQTLAFYLAALGLTLDRDGWRFEPVRGEHQSVSFRGPATPPGTDVVYEVFVTEIHGGPEPCVRADVLCSVAGVKACHAAGLGLALVQDWPLDDWRHTVPELGAAAPDPRAAVVDGRPMDNDAVLAFAWGRYAEALGPEFAGLDGPARALRAPAPPFQFMHRVHALDAVKGELRKGSWFETEYDVPDDAWFGGRSGDEPSPLPLAALMEVALQSCGWLAQFSGCCLGREGDLLFRNLDGTTRLLRTPDVRPTRVRTRVTLTDWADNGDTILLFFDAACRADDEDEPFFAVTTGFGFFPPAAFEGQTGLAPSAAERERRDEPSDYRADLTARPGTFFSGPLRLPDSDLLMLDRITGYWPPDAYGPGRMRAETDVDAGDWFFTAHFFQDPVQPGSLGVEAMYQLLRAYAIERHAADGLGEPHCAPVSGGTPLVWKYRGQVVPATRRVTVELEVTAEAEDLHGRSLEARGWLWADDTRIYRVEGLALRITPRAAERPGGHLAGGVLDPATDTWLTDHCPALTTPCVPMMHVARWVAEAAERATGDVAHQIRKVTVRRWITADTPVRYAAQVRRDRHGIQVEILVDDGTGAPDVVASGTVVPGKPEPVEPLQPLAGVRPVIELPYEGDAPHLFHGPAFHYLRGLRVGERGATGVLDPRRGAVPAAAHHSGLLDAALHGIPHQAMWLWDDTLPRDVIAFPYRLDALDLHQPLLGTAPLRCEVRLVDGDDLPAGSFVRVALQLYRGRVPAADMRLILALVPAGFLGATDLAARMAFARDRVYAAGLGVSVTTPEGTTQVTATAVRGSDWYPGLMSSLYGLPPSTDTPDRPEQLAQLAVRDHVGRLLRAHPSQVETDPDLSRAWPAGRPDQAMKVWVRPEGASVAVGTLAGPGGAG